MNSKIIALAAVVACGCAFRAAADTEWIITPKTSTSGLMQLHVNRDLTEKQVKGPDLMFDTRKQYGGKYKFLRVTNKGLCHSGINEKGVCVIFSGGDPTEDPNPKRSPQICDGHSGTVVILRDCPSAHAGVERLRRYFSKKLIFGSIIFFVADPYRAFIVECSPRHFASWELKLPFCVYTNCWKLPGMDDGSKGTADRAQWHYQREWAAREFLRLEMEKHKGMIPISSSLAVSRINAKDTKKKTVINGPSNKNTVTAYSFELDAEYPDYLGCVYVAFGPPRHTVYLPIPFAALDSLPRKLLNAKTAAAACARLKKAGESAPVDPALVELEQSILNEFAKTRERARRLLREDKNAQAKKLLKDNMIKQATRIGEYLDSLK